MVGDGAATLVARAFAAAGVEPPADALDRFLAIYNDRLLSHTRPYPGIPELLDALGARATLAVLTNKPLAATRRILGGLDLARYFAEDASSAATDRFRASPIRRDWRISMRARRRRSDGDAAGRRLGRRLAHGARRGDAVCSRATDSGSRAFPRRARTRRTGLSTGRGASASL